MISSKLRRKTKRYIRKLKTLVKGYTNNRNWLEMRGKKMERDLLVVKKNIIETNKALHDWEIQIQELEERLAKGTKK